MRVGALIAGAEVIHRLSTGYSQVIHRCVARASIRPRRCVARQLFRLLYAHGAHQVTHGLEVQLRRVRHLDVLLDLVAPLGDQFQGVRGNIRVYQRLR